FRRVLFRSRVPLPVHANAQLFGFAVQPAAALAPLTAIALLAIPALAVTRTRPGMPAAIGALQVAAVIADVPDAPANVRERGPLLAPIRPATGRDQRVAVQCGAVAAPQ